MKVCTRCGESKPESEFVKKKKQNLNWCRPCNAIYHREYRKKRKEKDPSYAEYEREKQREWWEKNREYGNKRQREYRKNNEKFRISNATRARYKYAVSNMLRGTMLETTFELVGCTPQEFRDHLESQFDEKMSWDNYATYWEIDHIQPIGTFDLNDPEQVKKAFHYTNCRPLYWEENRQRNREWQRKDNQA